MFWISLPHDSGSLSLMFLFLTRPHKHGSIKTFQKNVWSLGYTPVKTGSSSSWPVSVSRHFQQQYANTHSALCSGNLFTNSKWNLLNDFLYLMPTTAIWIPAHDLFDCNPKPFDLDSAFLLFSWIATRITSMPTRSQQLGALTLVRGSEPSFDLGLILHARFSHRYSEYIDYRVTLGFH